ncbi:zinc-binding alcohol dehydrogenase [Paramyrothecium foliicola]|nr:zinc-binding alcohol dehydrogenase [Paramyrothecium foliicola]
MMELSALEERQFLASTTFVKQRHTLDSPIDNMSGQDYKFEGWVGLDKEAANGKMVWSEFQPKKWEETDVDIKISHCGVCGSDMHTLRSGWGPTTYPACVGHEIIGTVVRAGSKVANGLKVGDRVGVGAQCDSCLGREGPCEDCAAGAENACTKKWVGTYQGKHYTGDIAQGGYALYNRSPSHFVIKIPDSIPSEHAAPMMCAGVTTYSPLKQNGCGPGKRVGVVGIGGLGHFAILWAKALGADQVVAISRRANKADDALEMGADAYIATEDEADWTTKHKGTLDIIISTVSSSKMPLGGYMSMLRRNGVLVQVGLPEDGVLQIPAGALVKGSVKLQGSLIGSPEELREMLQLAAEKNVQPRVEVRPMKDANQVIVDMEDGKARYRYVLANEEAQTKL